MNHTRLSLGVFVILLSLCAKSQNGRAQSTTLGNRASSMQPGTWAELSAVGFNNGAFLESSGASILQWSDKAVWNPLSKQLLFHGGPHYLPHKFVIYTDSNNTWSTGPPALSCSSCSSHGYQHNTINAAAGENYFRATGTKTIYRYSGGVWTPLPDVPSESASVSGAIEYFPERKGLLFVDGNWGVWFYSSNAWRKLANTGAESGRGLPKLTLGPIDNFGVYNPVHKVILFGGGDDSVSVGSMDMYKLDAAGTISKLKNAPIELGINQSIVTVDPVSGKYLIFGRDHSFREYDITTDTWTLRDGSTVPIWNPDVFDVVATPVSTYGVVMFVKYYFDQSKVYIYKHAAGTPPQPVSDFTTRCQATGVVRCVGFDAASEIAGQYGDNSGITPGNINSPIIDLATKASGNGSLKFTIPPNAGSDSSGSYFTNFSSDLSTQFGADSEFYVQWRQRFSPEFINTAYAGGEGWKQAAITTGDQPGKLYASCTSLGVTMNSYYHQRFPILYHSCTGSTSHGAYDGFYETWLNGPNGADFKLQNARPRPYCLYTQGNSTPPKFLPPSGNCFPYYSNEWMTFQIHIKTGPRVADEFKNSYVEMWMAREGQPSQPIVNWRPYNLSAGNPTDNERYGKIWLLPYNTNKDPSVTYPTAYTWYDELIISRNRIADPGGSVPPAPIRRE